MTLKAKGKLPVRAKEEEGIELELDGTNEVEGIDGVDELISFCKCSSCSLLKGEVPCWLSNILAAIWNARVFRLVLGFFQFWGFP